MKELELEFIGTGEVGGYLFRQKMNNGKAYIYEVSYGDVRYYEVFVRMIQKEGVIKREGKEIKIEAKVVYPKAEKFGYYAFTTRDWAQAMEHFRHFTELYDRWQVNKELRLAEADLASGEGGYVMEEDEFLIEDEIELEEEE